MGYEENEKERERERESHTPWEEEIREETRRCFASLTATEFISSKQPAKWNEQSQTTARVLDF